MALLVLLLAFPATAKAQSFKDYPEDTNWGGGRMSLIAPTYTLGAVMDTGAGMYTKGGVDYTPTLYGYRYSERMGIISGLVMAGWLKVLGVGLAGAVAAPQNTTTTVSRSKNYRTGVVTETRTTTGTVTAEQGRQAQSVLDSSESASMAAMGAMGQALDVVIYDDDWADTELGDGWGYRINFWLPIAATDSTQWELGWMIGDVISLDHERRIGVESYSFGFPVRFFYGFSQFTAMIQWDMNFGSFWSDEPRSERINGNTYYISETRPWPLTLELRALLWRFDVSGALVSSRPFDGDIGFRAGAGLRF